MFNYNNLDYFLIFYISILLCLNLILLISSTVEYKKFLIKTVINIIISLFMMLLFSQLNYKTYESYSYFFYFISLISIIFVNLFSKSIKGATRWLNIGFFKFQTSELSKISVPMIISSITYRFKNINSPKILLIILLLIFIPAFLIAIQPDLGTSIIVIISGLLALFFSGISAFNTLFISSIISLLGCIYWKYFMRIYQKNRIFILLNSKHDLLGLGYHIFQSKIAIGSGGILGKGLLNGTQSKLNFIPESHTDFIFSVLAEELGLIGVIILLSLYLCITIKCFNFALCSRNIFNKILISSFISSIFLSIFINIGMVSGILPIVGVPLPFISYGGSSLVILLIKLGMIMSMKNDNKNIFNYF